MIEVPFFCQPVLTAGVGFVAGGLAVDGGNLVVSFAVVPLTGNSGAESCGFSAAGIVPGNSGAVRFPVAGAEATVALSLLPPPSNSGGVVVTFSRQARKSQEKSKSNNVLFIVVRVGWLIGGCGFYVPQPLLGETYFVYFLAFAFALASWMIFSHDSARSA